MAGPDQREQYVAVMLAAGLTSIHSLFFGYQEWKGKEMPWLTLLKSCSFPNFDFSQIGLEGKYQQLFRQRVWLGTKLAILYLSFAIPVCITFSTFISHTNFPVGYRLQDRPVLVLLNIIVFTLFCLEAASFAFAVTFFFNQVTYYFVLRFKYLHSQLKELHSKSGKQLAVNLLKLLKELNSTFKLIHEFNQFWKYYIGYNYFIITLASSFLLYLGFFTQMAFVIQLMCAAAAVLVFTMLSAMSICAATVVKKASSNNQFLIFFK